MTPIILLCALASFALGGFGAILGRTPAGRIIVYGGSLAVAGAALLAALVQLGLGVAPEPSVALPLGLPLIGMNFGMNDLSAVFLVITNLGAAAASLYALGYGRHEPEPWRILPFYPVFLAAMNLVLIAADAYDFLIFWELMSLASWALVMAHHEQEETRRAGIIYLLMASAGTLVLLFAFGLLAGPHGHYAFAAMRGMQRAGWIGGIVMLLALAGVGSKAGLVPLHVWLPRAHPAAPSHISALMSGVMTKVAIYAFIRIVFDLAEPAAWWWGLAVLIVGGITAVLGVLYALMEDDLKTILAYSTIENVGLIFVGLGLALAFKADGMMVAAALALTAALFHAFNHMLFKSTLFFGAGAVQHATGERALTKLGGLIHRMKMSTVPMLIAAMAIAALPPLNGFASEWLLLQAILLSPALPQFGLKLAVPAVGALVALAAAFAAACFVRLFGFAYLGKPRSAQAAAAHETDAFSRAAMIGLAALCVVAGVLPGFVIDLLAPVTQALLGAHVPSQRGLSWLTVIPVSASRSSYDPLLIFIFIAVSGSLAALALHRFGSRVIRRAAFWGCGYQGLSDASARDVASSTQYSPSGFAQPIRQVFASVVFRARDDVVMPAPGQLGPASLASSWTDPAWWAIYTPLVTTVGRIADRVNRLQFLTIRRYLAFVFLALVILLAWTALWG
ncbi:hydrogenase 4 subunit B [Acidiphilium iwatense]|uniref:Hydrogenase 4 subunit B n=1 Tax=Acidiphilium iwatense TaxID=768198 RepID=A0ABS9DXR3_9PROT|nr:hydrogenase 4 subunit B [Acidiphilium iwatense]MCF3947539.1 hydrogenase 4 subunit B [Acidiphilium iwatense]